MREKNRRKMEFSSREASESSRILWGKGLFSHHEEPVMPHVSGS